MEQIKKQIYLNPYISRQHSFIPYIMKDERQLPLVMDGYEIDISTFSSNGNWGNYPYDININNCYGFSDDNGDYVNVDLLKTYFFNPERIPFREMVDIFNTLRSILYSAEYYRSILKNGEYVWVVDNPSFCEKIDINIYDELPLATKIDEKVGVHNDNSFAEYGGSNMLRFLFRAMGMFIVDKIYVTEDNGVPEIMYYSGIDGYINSMDKVRDSKECCNQGHFEFLGGNLFYGYLKYKKSKIEEEIKYWHNAICKNETHVLKEPYINLPIALNCECNTIGNYISTGIKIGEAPKGILSSMIREVVDESKLKYLRRSEITYCMKEGKQVPFDFILDVAKYKEGEDDVAEQYELTQPYLIGYPKNIKEPSSQIYYGDIIYQMDFLKNYHYKPSENEKGSSYADETTWEWDGGENTKYSGVIIKGNGFRTADDFFASPESEGWGMYSQKFNDKTSGTAEEEYDVWDNPEIAKDQGIFEFSHKCNIINGKAEKDVDGNITGWTETFKIEFIDFDKSDGVVHIFYEIGGRLKKSVDANTKKIVWGYNDNPSKMEYPLFADYVKAPKNNISPEMYLFLKKEFEVEENYTDEIIFKGDIQTNSIISVPEGDNEEIWVYKVKDKGYYLINNTIQECFSGDYLIIKQNKSMFHFNMKIVNRNGFTGIRYYERRGWKQHNYMDDSVQIYMLDDDFGRINILKNPSLVKNTTNVELVTYDKMDDDVVGLFYSDDARNLENNVLLMNDNDFGRVEMYVENSADVVIDRGFVSAFEMHYKLGEINTMEDMENYGNNFFGF